MPILDMTKVPVATTRRALAIIRKAQADSSPLTPFDPTLDLADADLPGVRYDHFCFAFVASHAMKRHRKCAGKN
jgi:hypothetical protein